MTGIISKERIQDAAAHPENREQSAHDCGGTGNDNAGDDAGLTVCVAFRHPIGTGPDFDDTPEKTDEAHYTETILKRRFQARWNLRQRNEWQRHRQSQILERSIKYS